MRDPEEMLQQSVVRIYADGSRQVFFGEFPIGGKIQGKGFRCPEDEHEFYIDRYPGLPKRPNSKGVVKNHEYVDRACSKCTRRIPIRG